MTVCSTPLAIHLPPFRKQREWETTAKKKENNTMGRESDFPIQPNNLQSTEILHSNLVQSR